jgi:hypothetical protein
VTSWRQLYYDDATSLKAKYDLVNGYGLRGAGIWALGYDDGRTELNAALAEKFGAPLITAASISTSAFSPNGDGIKDTVRAVVTSATATSWFFSAAPLTSAATESAPFHAFTGSGAPTVDWNGRNVHGELAPDAVYRLSITVTDAAGETDSRSWDVRLDTTPPAITAAPMPAAISPNGDGVAESTQLTWAAGEHAAGKVRIRTATGSNVKVWAAGASGALTWTGHSSTGTAVPDGRYTFMVDLTDGAGNRRVVEVPLIVDRTLSRLAWSPSLFFPHDGDAYARTATVSFRLSRTATTTLQVFGRDGTYIKTAWANRTLGAGTWSWTYNGYTGTRQLAPRGWYFARLITVTPIGTTVQTRLLLADAFGIEPSTWTPARGTSFTVTIRTAEPLAAAPRVTFTQPGLAGVARTATSLGGGRYRVTFTVAAGAPGAATIAVSGKDAAGRTNSRSITVTVK